MKQNPFRTALRLVQSDRHLRMLVIVALLFMSSLLLFPHYQKLGRSAADYSPARLMVWVVAQNAGAGFLSLLAGAIADRYGNRLALRMSILTAAITPTVALLLARYAPGNVFWVTFMMLGSVPTTIKTVVNYVLELTEPELHPQYISTVRLGMAMPLIASPLFGRLIEPDLLGFPVVFGIISAVVFTGGLLTFRMIEPRDMQAADA